MKFRRTLRYYYLRFIRLQGDPGSLARGVALGLFIGVTPTLPLHTILIVLLAGLLRSNLIAALLAATVVSNPLTFVPQYYLSWKVGNSITAGDLCWERVSGLIHMITNNAGFTAILKTTIDLGFETVSILLLGGCILAAPLAFMGYVSSFRFFDAVRRKRREKHILS